MTGTTCRTAAAIALVLGLGTLTAASAQGVWRCGPEGREYTDQPCPASGRAVDAADPRSAEQRLQAREVAERERRLGEALVRERTQREALPAVARPVARRKAPPAALPREAAPVSREPRTARAPAPQRSAAGTSRAAAHGSRRAAG